MTAPITAASQPFDVGALRPDTLLTRKQFAAALTASGRPISVGTLNTMASRGGGPPFSIWGTRSLYEWGPGLRWAEARTSPPQRSSSERDCRAA